MEYWKLPYVSFIRAVFDVVTQSFEHAACSCHISTVKYLKKLIGYCKSPNEKREGKTKGIYNNNIIKFIFQPISRKHS